MSSVHSESAWTRVYALDHIGIHAFCMILPYSRPDSTLSPCISHDARRADTPQKRHLVCQALYINSNKSKFKLLCSFKASNCIFSASLGSFALERRSQCDTRSGASTGKSLEGLVFVCLTHCFAFLYFFILLAVWLS